MARRARKFKLEPVGLRLFQRETWLIWQICISCSAFVSLLLAARPGARFLDSIAFTLAGGIFVACLTIKVLVPAINRRMEGCTRGPREPADEREFEGVGRLRWFGDYWQNKSTINGVQVHVEFEAGVEGPSDRQRRLWHELTRRFDEIRVGATSALRGFLDERGIEQAQDPILSEIAPDRLVVALPRDGNEDAGDIELTFEAADGGDMLYTVILADWRVIDVFCGD